MFSKPLEPKGIEGARLGLKEAKIAGDVHLKQTGGRGMWFGPCWMCLEDVCEWSRQARLGQDRETLRPLTGFGEAEVLRGDRVD